MHFIAMWRPETDGDWLPNMTFEQFKLRNDANAEKGLALVCLRQQPDSKFAAVWLPSINTGTPCITGKSITEFNSHDVANMNKNYRVADIQIVNPPLGTTVGVPVDDIEHSKFTCTWRPGAGAQQTLGDLDHKALLAQDTAFRAQGLQLWCLRIQDDGRFFGVWLPGTGATWTPPLSAADFKALDTKKFNEGFRLVDMDTKDSSVYVGIWHKGSGPLFWQDDFLPEIETADAKHKQEKLRVFKLIPHFDPPILIPGEASGGSQPPGTVETP